LISEHSGSDLLYRLDHDQCSSVHSLDWRFEVAKRLYSFEKVSFEYVGSIINDFLYSRFTADSWAVEFDFKIHGENSLSGDGFAFWFLFDDFKAGTS
jgi:hypothetical protein